LTHAEGGTGESELAMSSVGRARGRMQCESEEEDNTEEDSEEEEEIIASDEEHSELRVASLVAKVRICIVTNLNKIAHG
jgi:hypothetical protein